MKRPTESQNIEREERILEIQEAFESIYQQSQRLLQEQSGLKSANYMQTLQETIKYAESWHAKLLKDVDPKKDDFISKNAKIVGGFRTALKETIGLLQILEKIENQRKDLQHINFSGSRQSLNQPLNQEIRNSERRLQRLRAGVKLTKVLKEQIKVPQRPPSQPDLHVDHTALNLLQSMDRRNRVPLVDVAGSFHAQKMRVEAMMRQYVNDGANLDFTAKYGNLVNYFKERFKLANLFVGDEQIKEFLRMNQDHINKILSQDKAPEKTKVEAEFLKDLEPKNFVDDHNEDSNTLKKIMKVNQEIKRELMLEDHEDNIKAINNYRIQQKQNYWERMFDDDKPKMMKTSQVLTRKQILNNNRPATVDKVPQKRPIVSSLKKKTIYYQAHPNFPLIKQVYNDVDSNLLQQEERLREFIIEDQPQKNYTPNNNGSTLMESQFSRVGGRSAGWFKLPTEEIGQKTLSKLWGDTWVNY